MNRNFIWIILLQLVVSCAPLSQVQDKSEQLAYFPRSKDQTLQTLHLPTFIIEKRNKPYNRIGTPKAALTENGEEEIYTDPQEATIYVEERKFKTADDTYTNLIYRSHFSETPYGLFPFQIGAGKNVGLFVIVTLNSSNKPVLYTSVHTCGCYLAFIPTTYLSREAYPPDWPEKEQVVYSETLPALLDPMDKTMNNPTLMILLRDASHRVKNVWLSDKSSLNHFATNPVELHPITSLEHLLLKGSNQTTSFYETSGNRIGYVKGSYKPLERLLMSWWTLNWKIGEDKKLSVDKTAPPIFFTSLKPWARNASDLREFPSFLHYWGWNL